MTVGIICCFGTQLRFHQFAKTLKLLHHPRRQWRRYHWRCCTSHYLKKKLNLHQQQTTTDWSSEISCTGKFRCYILASPSVLWNDSSDNYHTTRFKSAAIDEAQMILSPERMHGSCLMPRGFGFVLISFSIKSIGSFQKINFKAIWQKTQDIWHRRIIKYCDKYRISWKSLTIWWCWQRSIFWISYKKIFIIWSMGMHNSTATQKSFSLPASFWGICLLLAFVLLR